MRHEEGSCSNDIEHTHAGRICIELVRFGRIDRDDFFSGVEDEGVVDRGFPIFSNGKKSEGDRPITPKLCQLQVTVGVKGCTRWFDYPFPQQDQTRGTYLDECGSHPLLQ